MKRLTLYVLTRAGVVGLLNQRHTAQVNTVAPGHGPAADGRVLEAQRQYFMALRTQVEKRKDLAPERVLAEVATIRSALLERHATYVDPSPKAVVGFESQVAKVYKELTGKEFPKRAALEEARRPHDRHHGLPVD